MVGYGSCEMKPGRESGQHISLRKSGSAGYQADFCLGSTVTATATYGKHVAGLELFSLFANTFVHLISYELCHYINGFCHSNPNADKRIDTDG